MKTKILAVWFCVFAASPLFAQYYPSQGDEFGPFGDEEKIEKIALVNLPVLNAVVTEGKSSEKLGLKDDPKGPYFQVETQTTGGHTETTFQLVRGKKKQTLQFVLGDIVNYKICTAELNGDKLPDYVVTGIVNDPATNPGEDEEGRRSKEDVVLLLSTGKGYKAYEISDVVFSPWSFIRLKEGPDIQFLHQTITSKKLDHVGTMENFDFHLYQLLNIHGSEIYPAKTLDSRFPKIVCQDLSAWRKNHKETKLLAPEEKKKLLKDHPVKIQEIPLVVLRKSKK